MAMFGGRVSVIRLQANLLIGRARNGKKEEQISRQLRPIHVLQRRRGNVQVLIRHGKIPTAYRSARFSLVDAAPASYRLFINPLIGIMVYFWDQLSVLKLLPPHLMLRQEYVAIRLPCFLS